MVWRWYSDQARAEYCRDCMRSFRPDDGGEDGGDGHEDEGYDDEGYGAPCGGCEWGPAHAPVLWGENDDAYELFQASMTQWRSGGMGGAVGLDYPAVFKVARILEIDLDRVMMGKIRALEKDTLKRADERRRENQERQNTKGVK